MPSINLRDYFTGYGTKYLSAVDVSDKDSNHQHEIGSNKIKSFLGDPGNAKKHFKGRFLYISDNEEDYLCSDSDLTWYDARLKNPDRSAEYRLYYDTNSVTQKMSEGDFLFIAGRTDGTVLLIITPRGSSAENQIRCLFDLQNEISTTMRAGTISSKKEDSFVKKMILEELGEELGIEVEQDDPNLLTMLLNKFNGIFPSTREFSDFARESLGGHSSQDSPDDLFLSWYERENTLFHTLEKHLLSQNVEIGFDDVDDFIAFSLSVQNRRKSRAGHAAENHLEKIFSIYGLSFSWGAKTEGKSKPDFLFPEVKYYNDDSFSSELLSMLGSKTTCKDRWRQVLAEAARIPHKHLFTLQPAISIDQTDEMKRQNLTLVIPEAIRASYKGNQQQEIMTLSSFIDMVKNKEITWKK